MGLKLHLNREARARAAASAPSAGSASAMSSGSSVRDGLIMQVIQENDALTRQFEEDPVQARKELSEAMGF